MTMHPDITPSILIVGRERPKDVSLILHEQ